MSTIVELATPAILVDRTRLEHNIRSMQAAGDAHGVELRPHMKTHKMVAVARRQLAAGARGLTCAKIGEAEAMLPSGVKSLFIAHSLVDPRQAPRIAALAEQLEDLRVGVTSEAQAVPLARLARLAGRRLKVMMAVDTGLGREGTRSLAEVKALAAHLALSRDLDLAGFYTHEGQTYGADDPTRHAAQFTEILDALCAARDAVDPKLPIWPGCSVSARWMANSGRPQAVRPGSYVFSDLSLTVTTRVATPGEEALHILTTVVDRPAPGLALIDAGSKSLSGDRTPAGIHAVSADGRDLNVFRVNEEHGYVHGAAVDSLRIGEKLRLIPAHVCPVMNLTDEVIVVEGESVVDRWPVEARGRVR